jgi:hypothetical protein
MKIRQHPIQSIQTQKLGSNKGNLVCKLSQLFYTDSIETSTLLFVDMIYYVDILLLIYYNKL